MENGSAYGSTEMDLREENGEFCRLWGCRSYKIGYSCHWCPVLSDLKRMASAFKVKIQIMEAVTENPLKQCTNTINAVFK